MPVIRSTRKHQEPEIIEEKTIPPEEMNFREEKPIGLEHYINDDDGDEIEITKRSLLVKKILDNKEYKDHILNSIMEWGCLECCNFCDKDIYEIINEWEMIEFCENDLGLNQEELNGMKEFEEKGKLEDIMGDMNIN